MPYYDAGGNPVRDLKTVTVPTYAMWVSAKLKAEGNAIVFGINEVFEQDFATQSPAVNASQGLGKGNRRWRILKAAELIREKR